MSLNKAGTYKKRRIISGLIDIEGIKLNLSGYNDDDYIQSIIEAKDYTYDRDLLTALKAAMTNSGTLLDVGANIGYIACFMAKKYPKSTIHCYEPVLSNINLLRKNLNNNMINNVIVHSYGLANKSMVTSASWAKFNRGSAFITESEHEYYPERERVEVRKLDDIYLNKIGITSCALVKIDIEGYELEFLKGSKKFLNEFMPTVIMEANHWCLNGLHNIPMASFLDQLSKIFPYIDAFWDGHTIDINKHRELFMHENIVFNKYMNLICSFDKMRHNNIIAKYKRYSKNSPIVSTNVDLDLQYQESLNEINKLHLRIKELENAGIKSSTKMLTKAVTWRLRSGN